MTAPLCVCGCGRPVIDGYARTECAVERPRRLLAEIRDLVPVVRDRAYGLSRSQSASGATGVPGPRFPINLAAMAKLDALDRVLTKWIDRIGPARGVTRPWFTHHGDRILIAVQWLSDHLEWLRHRDEWTDEWLTDVEACARIVRSEARGPGEQRYLGPCGATVLDDVTTVDPEHGEGIRTYAERECQGDVYGYVGAEQGRCRTCGATVSQDERRAWLDGLTRDRAYRASEIEDAHGIKAHNIRNWADKGRIRVHGHDHLGRNLYLLGDVLDHARDLARRKAENQAKRAARAPA